MKLAFYDRAHFGHEPKMWFYRGAVRENRETGARAELLEHSLLDAGFDVREPRDFGKAPLLAVHSQRYLDFLETAYEQWIALDGTGPEVVANMFPIGKDPYYPEIIVGRAGFHMEDLSCPIGLHTWAAAYGAAQSAVAAADALTNGGTTSIYALCRPPGHHAFSERAAGYCYLNNAAIAAQYLRDRGSAKVTILDVDVHHGNGTQDIFYDRGDVQFVSLHGDPNHFSPFFWGFREQVGRGEGEGTTSNYPLPLGTGDEKYFEALAVALQAIEGFAPDALVISLGLDTFIHDPYAAFAITTPGYETMSSMIRALNLPTLVVQEGGYMCPELGDNLISFMNGLT